MRKIEFRIWDKELKEMNYLSLEDLCEDDYWYDGETSVWSVLYDCNNENERFVINQYTGLTDKNGKKIFEGDMLKSYYDKPGIVKWNNEIGAFQIKGIPSQTMKRCYQMEVIGNIYESKINE